MGRGSESDDSSVVIILERDAWDTAIATPAAARAEDAMGASPTASGEWVSLPLRVREDDTDIADVVAIDESASEGGFAVVDQEAEVEVDRGTNAGCEEYNGNEVVDDRSNEMDRESENMDDGESESDTQSEEEGGSAAP